MRTINLHEAKTHLSRFVDQAAAGEEIIIARAGRPWRASVTCRSSILISTMGAPWYSALKVARRTECFRTLRLGDDEVQQGCPPAARYLRSSSPARAGPWPV
ncbi:MAG: type II toxin-antitoxin system Phd/YefM family antitoxin [Magnetococcales bacterium]|nr:type II toxin-antitoxin system Phd/YefM family antitoxin [Magnetococcales bacterium]